MTKSAQLSPDAKLIDPSDMLPDFDFNLRFVDGCLGVGEAIRVLKHVFRAEELSCFKPTTWEANFMDGCARILCSGKCQALTADQTQTMVGLLGKVHLARFIVKQAPRMTTTEGK